MEGLKKTRCGCKGFLQVSRFRKMRRTVRFEEVASVLDAARSLLFLQLPFMIWRLWFDSFSVDVLQLGNRTLLISKNAIWGAINLIQILSCGDEKATLCGWQPLKALHSAADSQFGKVWVGPNGMTAFVAEHLGAMEKERTATNKHLLESHRDWLMNEMNGASKEHRDAYEEKLDQVNMKLEVTEEKMHFTFP